MRILLLAFTLLLLTNSEAQKATYSLSFGSIKVGELHAEQFKDGNITVVKVKSSAEISLGLSYSVRYTQTSRYDSEKLLDAEVKIYKNDELYNSATTHWNGNYYEITHNGNNLKLSTPIKYSSTCLYFNEPKNVERVFSESDCELRSITKKGVNAYRVNEQHSSRKNDYHYENGVMNEGTIHHSIVDFKVTLTSYDP